MRKILPLVCVLGLSSASFSQVNQTTWTNLSSLSPGQKIQIVETTSKKHAGAFTSVSDTSILYRDSAGEQSIPKQDIRSVKLTENKHRLRNTLIAAGVGAGAGAGIGAAAWEPHGFVGGRGVGAAVGAVIGGVGGAIVGALIPSHSTIYNVSPH